jgi:hypothetical protein
MTQPYDSWLSEQVEKIRNPAPPDPAIVAQRLQDRRFMNSRVYEVEIARHNELIGTIAKNNVALTALGDLAMNIGAVEPLDLSRHALDDCNAALGRQIRQQSDRLEYLRAAAAEAERERMIAKETPIERLARENAELRGEVAAISTRQQQMEAGNHVQRYSPPPRPLPPMAFAAVGMGDGLTPGFCLPPGSGAGAAAQRVGAAQRADSRPAISHGNFERHGHGDTPEQFLQTIQAVAARR